MGDGVFISPLRSSCVLFINLFIFVLDSFRFSNVFVVSCSFFTNSGNYMISSNILIVYALNSSL